MTAPSIARLRVSPKFYFTADDGSRWRVHDCVFEKGRFPALRTPSSAATSRVFVAANGMKKSYRFTHGESHELTESRLAAQLQKAGYLATEKYNPNEREAR